MRLFAALPLEGEAKAELERLLSRYRQMDWPVKWVRDDGLHVTIKFLGEVEADRVDAVREALRSAGAGTPCLPFTPTEIGAFPNMHRPRILWAGYESEPPLELMVHRVERGMEALGFPVDGRPFRPHVTLGRLREGRCLPPDGARTFEREQLHSAFVAGRLVLFESRPGPNGSVYQPVEILNLGS
jgi:2'-5' RNA ligase